MKSKISLFVSLALVLTNVVFADGSTGSVDDGKRISGWIAKLADPDPNVRHAAAYSLGEIGPPAEAAVPALRKMLAEQRLDLRISAAEALGKIGSAAQSAVPELLEAMNDKRIRSKAAEALVQILPEVVAALVEARAELPGARSRKTRSLLTAKRLAAQEQANRAMLLAQVELQRAMADQQAAIAEEKKRAELQVLRVQLEARRAAELIARGQLAARAQAVLNAPPPRRPMPRESARLVRSQPQNEIGELTAALRNENPLARANAAAELGKLGAAANAAASELTRLLKDEYRLVREQAAEALKRVDAKVPRKNGEPRGTPN